MNRPFATAFYLSTFAIAALVGNCSSAAANGSKLLEEDRPNIILFVTDDQSPFADRARGKYDSAKAFGFNGDDFLASLRR